MSHVIIEVDLCAVQRLVCRFASFSFLNNAISNSPFLRRDGIIEFTFLEQRIILSKADRNELFISIRSQKFNLVLLIELFTFIFRHKTKGLRYFTIIMN